MSLRTEYTYLVYHVHFKAAAVKGILTRRRYLDVKFEDLQSLSYVWFEVCHAYRSFQQQATLRELG